MFSNDIGELLTALSKCQAEMNNVSKSKQGHGYKYAELSSCIDVAREPMSNNGLSISQCMSLVDGQQCMVTVLGHSSGQYMTSTYSLEAVGLKAANNAQQMGAAITYARRYCFAAIIGLAQEDDDAASVPQSKPSDDKPWYNSFDADMQNMIAAIRNGSMTSQQVLDQVCESYKVNKEIRAAILALK